MYFHPSRIYAPHLTGIPSALGLLACVVDLHGSQNQANHSNSKAHWFHRIRVTGGLSNLGT